MNHLMETLEAPPPNLTSATPPWTLQFWPKVDSTNSRAATLPPWSAVLAGSQTSGRGRNGRTWVSDSGGLWLSAVLPCPAPRSQWAILPLAAGGALLRTLRALGVVEPRLRWPNDVMIGRLKLAGLLVERFAPDSAVIGIGLNVFNQPEFGDPTLAGTTTRLADLTELKCSLLDLTERVLASLRAMHSTLAAGRFHELVDELNHSWGEPRRVSLQLHDGDAPILGVFRGVDALGRVRVDSAATGAAVYDASQVLHFRELA